MTGETDHIPDAGKMVSLIAECRLHAGIAEEQGHGIVADRYRRIIEALSAPLPVEEEAVAWRYKRKGREAWHTTGSYTTYVAVRDRPCLFDAQPLYAAPPAGGQEGLGSSLRDTHRDADGAVLAALTECEEVLRLSEHPAFPDPLYHDEVKALGRRIGFGALMSTASAGWREVLVERGDPLGGEFVAGPCFATVQATLARVRAALAPPPPSASVSPGTDERSEGVNYNPAGQELREKVEIADEWLSLVEGLPLEAAGSILRWAPICQTEIDAIRAILSALQSAGEGS